MLKLNMLSEAEKDVHYNLIKSRFTKGLTSSLNALGKKVYDKDVITHISNSLKLIAVGSPSEIEAFATEMTLKFPDFSGYAAARSKPKQPRYRKHKNTLEIIAKCLNYDLFSSTRNGWGAYSLVQAYKLRICPYCQANHVNLHMGLEDGDTPSFMLRPPLDHYLPKSVYPYLAVSLSNLVPCCAQCNSGVKTSSDPRGMGFAHPLDATAIRVQFSTEGTLRKRINGRVEPDELVLSLTGVDRASVDHLSAFRLEERYQWYRHEIKDMIDRHDQYQEINRTLRAAICRTNYVLGFEKEKAESRSLGLCLLDVFAEL